MFLIKGPGWGGSDGSYVRAFLCHRTNRKHASVLGSKCFHRKPMAHVKACALGCGASLWNYECVWGNACVWVVKADFCRLPTHFLPECVTVWVVSIPLSNVRTRFLLCVCYPHPAQINHHNPAATINLTLNQNRLCFLNSEHNSTFLYDLQTHFSFPSLFTLQVLWQKHLWKDACRDQGPN